MSITGITFVETKQIEMEYNKKKMIKELAELNKKLAGFEIAQIAGQEQVTTQTIRNYLKGGVTTPSLAAAIIEAGKNIIKNKQS